MEGVGDWRPGAVMMRITGAGYKIKQHALGCGKQGEHGLSDSGKDHYCRSTSDRRRVLSVSTSRLTMCAVPIVPAGYSGSKGDSA